MKKSNSRIINIWVIESNANINFMFISIEIEENFQNWNDLVIKIDNYFIIWMGRIESYKFHYKNYIFIKLYVFKGIIVCKEKVIVVFLSINLKFKGRNYSFIFMSCHILTMMCRCLKRYLRRKTKRWKQIDNNCRSRGAQKKNQCS